jgi:hypothetical protein
MPHADDRTTRHATVTLRPQIPPRRGLFAPRDRHLSRDRVQDLVDGETARPDELAHLERCPTCASELRIYQHVVALVQELARATRRDLRLLAVAGRRCLTDANDSQE